MQPHDFFLVIFGCGMGWVAKWLHNKKQPAKGKDKRSRAIPGGTKKAKEKKAIPPTGEPLPMD